MLSISLDPLADNAIINPPDATNHKQRGTKMTKILDQLKWTPVGTKGERSKAILNGVGKMMAGQRRATVEVGVTATGYMLAWKWSDQIPPVKVMVAATSLIEAKQLLLAEGFEKMAAAINDAMRLRGDESRDGGKLGQLNSVSAAF